MSGSHRPIPSYCDDVSWSESSHTTSTQNSIDSLVWSIDNPFQEDIYIPTQYGTSFVDFKTVDTRVDDSVGNLESKDTTCMSVSLDEDMCLAPSLPPVKAGNKFMSYKVCHKMEKLLFRNIYKQISYLMKSAKCFRSKINFYYGKLFCRI